MLFYFYLTYNDLVLLTTILEKSYTKLGVIDLLFDFALIGGDERLTYMAENLSDMKYNVTTYCLDVKEQKTNVFAAKSLKDAIESAKVLICPTPFTFDNKTIVSKALNCVLSIEEFKNNITKNNILFAGCIPKEILDICKQKNITVYDYMENNHLAIYNSIATAEGAIAEAIINQPTNLHLSNCLVLGFGRCAKTLANKLKGLLAKVSICAIDEDSRSEANAYGYNSFDFSQLKNKIKDFKYIFNTIPSIILDENILPFVDSDVFILDIARGVDMDFCKDKHINAKLSLGIPGRFSPKSSADALTNLTLKIINET